MNGRVNYKKFNIIPLLLLLIASILLFGGMKASADFLPAIDNTLTIKAMGKVYQFNYPEIDVYKGELYLKNAEEVVDGIYLDTLKRPIDAEVVIHPELENPFEFKRERNGRGIDKEDLLVKIHKALNCGEKDVKAKEIIIKPSQTVEKLKKSTYRRAYFTTNYPYSSDERKHNIALCAKYLGGRVLMPYEEFSFNNAVGERTESRGFKGAKIIENGKFTDGIGGGACQVSSTVYNAALLAGLKITERHNHSLAVSYVEPSFDAMVSGNYADLKFVNDTGSIVFLTAKVYGDSITVTVYGEKPTVSYKREYEIIEKTSPPEIKRIPTSDLLIGEEKVSVYPKDGVKSKGYLVVYRNGAIIERRLISTDTYKPLQGEILVGEDLKNIE